MGNNIFYIKQRLQRIFRKTRLSDADSWNMCFETAPLILKRLIAFRKIELSGSPFDFIDTNEGSGLTDEMYNQYIADGTIVGGGYDSWIKTIDEMIFAFEYNLAENEYTDKKRKEVFNKYNLTEIYTYDENDRLTINSELSREYSERANKGMLFFGKYFWNLWD